MIDRWLEGGLFRAEQNDCILRFCVMSQSVIGLIFGDVYLLGPMMTM